jgi:uncharacterized protein YndB with AHSA1/START domain
MKIGNTSYSVNKEIMVRAPIESVWDCLLDPEKSAEFFFGISFKSDLKKGSPIEWTGEWEGKSFTDRGIILDIEKPTLFRYDYFSALSGLPDSKENHQILTYTFDQVGDAVRLGISQTNIVTEAQRAHSEQNWATMLDMIKKKLENG